MEGNKQAVAKHKQMSMSQFYEWLNEHGINYKYDKELNQFTIKYDDVYRIVNILLEEQWGKPYPEASPENPSPYSQGWYQDMADLIMPHLHGVRVTDIHDKFMKIEERIMNDIFLL